MSLDELERAPDFAARLADEFPQGASIWEEGLSRRRFLQLMGASIALAGLNGCMRLPDEEIVPYTQQPEKLIPGRSLHFATTLRINGAPRGVVVTQNEGRPTHIAGNPLHPLSLGAADAWTTASLLELYDPERLQSVLFHQEISTWDAFAQQATAWQAEWTKSGGAGLCLLTGPVDSPTQLGLIGRLLAAYPQARWYQHEPIPNDVEPLDIASANLIVSFESDFLFDRPDSLALTRAFSRRRQSEDGATWNRLYVVEACPTITGAKADHRFAVSPGDLAALAAEMIDTLDGTPTPNSRWPWLKALADDVHQHEGKCLFIAGRSAGPDVAEAMLMANQLYGKPSTPRSVVNNPSSLADLVAHLRAGEVSTLLMLGGNPVYDAPADFDLASLLPKVPTLFHHTLQANETSALCSWVTNAAHDLEAWGDCKSIDGTVSLRQPLIAPLYAGRSEIELLSLLLDPPGQSGYDLVRSTYETIPPVASDAFEAQWRIWLRDGVITTPPASPAPASVPVAAPDVVPNPAPAQPVSTQNPWLLFRPSAAVWTGATPTTAGCRNCPTRSRS